MPGSRILRTVLVAVADPLLREAIRGALTEAGFGIDEARSGISALAAALGHHPDLALVEAALPDIDGFAVTARLRGRGFSPPIVLVAAPEAAGRALAAGATGVLPLPLPQDASAVAAGVDAFFAQPAPAQGAAERTAPARNTAAPRETDRFRSEFMQAVSHELATPLTPIAGYLKILRSEKLGPLNERQTKVVDAMVQSTERLARVLDNLVDFANLETGRTLLRHGPVEPRAVAEACIAEMRAAARNRRVGLELYDESGGRALVGDEAKLKQALGNLVDNAVKFSPSGGQVLVELRPAGDGLEISVYDQGAGIPADETEKVFEPFFHASRVGEADRAPGAGLGLPVVRSIAQAHGGWARVESPPRRQPDLAGHFYPGSRFTMLLPWEAPSGS